MHHPSIKRYSLIIEIVKNWKYPSFKDIKKYLYDEGFEMSDRNIQRDIERIRDDFGLEMPYEQKKNGYYIDEKKSLNIKSFYKFLEIVSTAEVLTESLKDTKDVLKYISFEGEGMLRGVQYLKDILTGIRKHRKISFTYKRFQADEEKKHEIHPYLIKEYQNRWYVIGKTSPTSYFITFGLDRMTEFKLTTKRFKPVKTKDPREIFENKVGLTYTKEKTQFVVLSFSPVQAKYEKTLPIHRSFEIIKETKNEVQFKYFIIPNFEFEQKILQHGENVKVVKPKWLAEKIKNRLRTAQKKYR
ncbi:WYL domain-containing protein [Bacteroidales bacterium AH-315-N07]|nr:WYL domain-containing protein [Bacteroidales bacterium AH-315-N07]